MTILVFASLLVFGDQLAWCRSPTALAVHRANRDLLAIGFTAGSDGVLAAPDISRVKLAPIGNFYELRISLGDGTAVIAVLSKSAVKITRERKP